MSGQGVSCLVLSVVSSLVELWAGLVASSPVSSGESSPVMPHSVVSCRASQSDQPTLAPVGPSYVGQVQPSLALLRRGMVSRAKSCYVGRVGSCLVASTHAPPCYVGQVSSSHAIPSDVMPSHVGRVKPGYAPHRLVAPRRTSRVQSRRLPL